LIEIMAIVLIMGLLAALAIPNIVKARTETQKTLCISNLRVVDGAKELWALISRSAPGDPVKENEVDLLVKKGMPHCPARGVYIYGVIGAPPTCTLAREQGHILQWAGQREKDPEASEQEEKQGKQVRETKGRKGKRIGAEIGQGKEKKGGTPA
jgi:competence protein ComGC